MSISIYDVVVLLVIAFFAYRGFFKGLVATALGFIGFIISFIVARMFAPRLASLVTETSVFEWLDNFINVRLTDLQSRGVENFVNFLESPPQGQEHGLINQFIQKGLSEGKVIDSSNIIEFLSLSIANLIVLIISFIIIFVILSSLIGVLLSLVKGFMSLPGLKQLDSSGGFIFGALQGIFVAYIVIMIFVLFNFGGIAGSFENTLIIKRMLQFIPI